MPASIIPVYDLQDLQKPLIPSRSRLYHLEPIGIGTPYTESLSSYFTRLARAHCVEPRELALREVLPLIRGEDSSVYNDANQQRWLSNAFAMNGKDSTAINWISALEKLTLRHDLRFLTMSTWSSILSYKQRLVRRTRAWCPLCYDEWSICYEPLLWQLEVITECPHHRQMLRDRCPNQSCGYLPPLLGSRQQGSHHQAGLCPRCGGSLSSSSQNTVTKSNNEQEWQWRLGASIGELIAATPRLSAPPNLEGVALGIAHYRSKGAVNESLDSMAERLGVDPYQLWSMQSKQHAPPLENLLRLYFLMDLPLLDFVTQTGKTFAPKLPTITDTPNIQIQDQYMIADSESHELKLMAILMSIENPPHMREIAKRLGCPATSLMLRFPGLYQAILERRRRALENENVRSVLEAALASDVDSQPRLKDIAKQLGCSIQLLQERFPELCRSIVTLHQKRVDIDGVRKDLEKLLADHEHPPYTMKEVTEQLGWSYGSLKDYFPQLCRLINKRRQEYIKNVHMNTQRVMDASKRREVLEAILSDDQIPVPSLQHLARSFGCSPITLRHHFPELCSAIVEKRQRKPDLTSLREALEKVLSSNERPPTGTVLARNLNTTVHTLRHHFPQQYADLKKRRNFETDSQRERLKTIVEENENITVRELAQLIGCDVSTIRILFPEITQTIIERHQRPINIEELTQKMEAILMDSLTLSSSMKDIAKSLGYTALRLKRHLPELYQAIVDRKQIDINGLQQSLELVLLNEAIPISMREVARRIGHSHDTIRAKYPELYDAISQRYRDYQGEKHRLRIKNACEEVRQLMFAAHFRGQYPGVNLLRRLMSNSHDLRIPEVNSARRETLKELGYQQGM